MRTRRPVATAASAHAVARVIRTIRQVSVSRSASIEAFATSGMLPVAT